MLYAVKKYYEQQSIEYYYMCHFVCNYIFVEFDSIKKLYGTGNVEWEHWGQVVRPAKA